MANRLPELRKKKKLTQADLAEKACVSRSIIARYEAGITGISVKNLSKLAQALHCKMNDITEEPKDGTTADG